MDIFFSLPENVQENDKNTNKVKTSRYTAYSWAPKSLILQFKRAANIYFLIISILTLQPFSPKSPASMIGTFAAILIFTMFKEGYEVNFLSHSNLLQDIARHRSDYELNNKKTQVFNHKEQSFQEVKWSQVKTGQVIKVIKDQDFPSDILLMKADKKEGIVFVDTMQLDGETNLKERTAPKETNNLQELEIANMMGHMNCDSPNENMNSWDCNVTVPINKQTKTFNCRESSLILRGCTLKNTEYCIGIVVNTGPETKIMMNAKKPPAKVSNVQRMMNYMLYSVFLFQLVLILLFAILSNFWFAQNGSDHMYLGKTAEPGMKTVFLQLLTYWVAYSHLIPISLYVVLEMVKMGQAKIIDFDVRIIDQETGNSQCRNSDLIEELGQVEFIFSDKTGTLTCNVMEFKNCSVNNVIYKNFKEMRDVFKKKNSSSPEDREAMYQFYKLMAVCHSVVIDKDEEGKTKMSASSPDELALVAGSDKVGFHFTERTSTSVTIEIDWEKERPKQTYEILVEFPFDSTRKRMSNLVRDLETKEIWLMTKGADNIMIPRLQLEQDNQRIIEEQLYYFACTGLRTLMMGQKRVDEKEYKEWFKKYDKVNTSGAADKAEQQAALFDEMEQGLTYVGCSAIEDLLQDKVPETIQVLLDAEIRLWVLTGDKQETAIEIGKSCNLIDESSMELIILTSKTKKELDVRLTEALMRQQTLAKRSIVIDGPTLAFVFSSENLQRKFFNFGCEAASVICCRVSPKQKSDVVGLAKKYDKKITLSIGDGANDVPMIMEAHIGIGIRGKEGSQAVRSADYAIGQFKFLHNLLLVHGRWGYRRVGMFICYYFYKNVILVFCEMWFAFYNGYSGQIYFADWLPMLYNSFWTSWPCIFTYILERDVGYSSSLENPILYRAGQIKFYFNFKVFWKWMGFALFHGIVAFFLTEYSIEGPNISDGKTVTHWHISTISFSICLHLATYKLFVESTFINMLNLSAGVASLIIYYIMLIIGSVSPIARIFQEELNGIFMIITNSGKLVMTIVILPFIALIPDLCLIFIQKIFYPTPTDIHLLKENQKKSNYTPDETLNQTTVQAKLKSRNSKGDIKPSLYLNNLSTKGQAGQYKMIEENDQSQAYVPGGPNPSTNEVSEFALSPQEKNFGRKSNNLLAHVQSVERGKHFTKTQGAEKDVSGWSIEQDSNMNTKGLNRSMEKKKRRASKKGKKTQRDMKTKPVMNDEEYFQNKILGTPIPSSNYPTTDQKQRIDTHDPMRVQNEEDFDIDALEKELQMK